MNNSTSSNKKNKEHIAIVIPAFNEAGNIGVVANSIKKYFNEIKETSFEIIFVNDGSTDNTIFELKELANAESNVTVVDLSRNWGHQYALKAGLDYADADAVIMMDCDMQHPVDLFANLIDCWKSEGAEIVQAVRSKSNDPILKKLASSTFYKVINYLSDTIIVEGGADFRLIDRKVLLELKKIKENHFFLRGIIPWLGFNQKIVMYQPDERAFGKSSYNLKRMLRLAMNGVTSFSTKPLIISSILGFLLLIFSTLYFSYVLVLTITSPDIVIPGWSSLIISILFIGGVQLFSIGIIGVYLGNVYIESKSRPSFIVREVHKHVK
jgi:dolichol-phosphate mannosyltransferase